MKLDKILEKQAELINEAKRLIGINQKEELTAEQKELIEKYAFLIGLRLNLSWYADLEPDWKRFTSERHKQEFTEEYNKFWAMVEGIEQEYGKDIDSWLLDELEKLSNEEEGILKIPPENLMKWKNNLMEGKNYLKYLLNN